MERKFYLDNDAAGNVYMVIKTFESGHLEKHERIRLHGEYFDTDSVIAREDLKGKLNSIYGRKVVSDTMRKDYIVVHEDGLAGIVFKSCIIGVFRNPSTMKNPTRIVLVGGKMIFVDEDYSAIVKAVLS